MSGRRAPPAHAGNGRVRMRGTGMRGPAARSPMATGVG